jgi:hypothetical protein
VVVATMCGRESNGYRAWFHPGSVG